MTDVQSTEDQREKMREGGGRHMRGQTWEGNKKRKGAKCCCGLYLEALGKDRVHVISCREGKQWSSGDWRWSAQCKEREWEEGEGRGWITWTESRSVWEALCLMCASQENEWWGLQLHFLLHWTVFNRNLFPLSQHLNTGFCSCCQPLSCQVLWGNAGKIVSLDFLLIVFWLNDSSSFILTVFQRRNFLII